MYFKIILKTLKLKKNKKLLNKLKISNRNVIVQYTFILLVINKNAT